MMEYILKLEERFWKQIESGIKVVEIRKTDKKYITSNDTICFTDSSGLIVFGRATVMSSTLMKKGSVLKYNGLDKDTRQFIQINYKDEDTLLFLHIVPYKSEYAVKRQIIETLHNSDDGIQEILEIIIEAFDDSEITGLTNRLAEMY